VIDLDIRCFGNYKMFEPVTSQSVIGALVSLNS
jgi:hypothetical protein